jgi:hypothetical protein
VSAMSELDHLLTEYQQARNVMNHHGANLSGYIAATDNALRAADVLAHGLRSMLTANGDPMTVGVDVCKGAGKQPTSTTVTDGDWMRGMCGVCGSEGHRLTKDGRIPAHAASFRRDRDRV